MIFELAGELGLAPFEFSLRRMEQMATAKRKAEWLQTSFIVAMIHNTSTRCKQPKAPRDFNPTMRKSDVPTLQLSAKQTVAILKAALLPPKD